MRFYNLSIICVLLSLYSSFAQAPDPIPEINGHYVTVPPSPTAYEFTKYGDVSVNEYKGMVSPSIPLYTYKAGNLELPISMSYSGNGVKVPQLSSWTGINWNLNAGGVITRTVKDRPDELSSTIRRFYTSRNELLALSSTEMYNLANPRHFYDTQLDEFNFRFLNYSGSFYLDKNDNLKLATSNAELKIIGNLTGNESDDILIITPDGTKYIFGGEGFVEQSEMIAGGSASNQNNIWNTSYYLAKIIHPKGDTIYFHYGSGVPYRIRWSSSERMTYVSHLSPLVTTIKDSLIPPGYTDPTYTIVYNRIKNGKYLEKITSNRTGIIVDFLSSPQTTTTYDYTRILNKIEISNPLGPSGKEIGLSYYRPQTNINTRCRFFLKEINLFEEGKYKFAYYNMDYSNNISELPDRFSYAQDFFGYYNGQDSNETLLPADASPHFPQGALGMTFANRNPSFEHAVTGSLKKIIFPTGGHTHFEYEPNPKIVQLSKNVQIEVFNNKQAFFPPGYPTSTQLVATGSIGTCLQPVPGSQGPQPQPLVSDQRIYFDLEYTVLSGSPTGKYDFEITIKDITSSPASIISQRTFDLQGHPSPAPGDPPSYTHHLDFHEDLEKGHCYSVQLELIVDQAWPGMENEPVLANLSFSYEQGYSCQPNGIGLRVKRVTDFTKDNAPTSVKRYYYKSAEDYMNNKQKCYPANFGSFYVGEAFVNVCPPKDDGDGLPTLGQIYEPFEVPFIKADTHNSTVREASEGFSYEFVTISLGGDHFEEGGMEKKFNYRPKNNIINSFSGEGEVGSYANSVSSNRHIFGGELLSKKYLINDPLEGLKIQKIEKRSYSDYWTDYEWNVYLDRYYCTCNEMANNPIYYLDTLSYPDHLEKRGFFAGFYRSFQNKFDLDTLTEVEYIDPLPVLSQNDDSGYRKIVKETYFEYDDYVGLPSKIIKTTSNQNEFMVTRMYYPGGSAPPNSSGGDIGMWDNLAMQHRIASPIHTETYLKKNNSLALLSSEQTTYDFFNGLVLPSSLKFSKGNAALKKRVDFIDYNVMGRLEKLSVNGGPEINYTYDTGGKVTSKIEGTGSTTHVTLYEYDGMDRLIKVTDPRGYEMNYEYDPAGRLKSIKDDDGNLLQSYEYHYAK